MVSFPPGDQLSMILPPWFAVPPDLGKMAAGGEWERAHIFPPRSFTSEEEARKYLGSKEEIACEAFFGDAFFGVRRRGTPEELLVFVLDFASALASAVDGEEFFGLLAEGLDVQIGKRFLFAEVGAVDAWKSVGTYRIDDPCAALAEFEELLSGLARSPVGRECEHKMAIEFAFDGDGLEHWIALPVSDGPAINPGKLKEALNWFCGMMFGLPRS